MRKIVIVGFLVTVSLLFNTCDIEQPARYLSINGQDITLSTAVKYDYGTDFNITLREYWIDFKSSDLNPRDFLNINICSTSTEELERGVYTFSNLAYEAGYIGYLEFGTNIRYDDLGVAISGTRITEADATISGTVTVGWKNDKYDFIFDLTIEYKGQVYYVTGEYNDYLQEEIGV